MQTWGRKSLAACRELDPSHIILATLPALVCPFIADVLQVPITVAHLSYACMYACKLEDTLMVHPDRYHQPRSTPLL